MSLAVGSFLLFTSCDDESGDTDPLVGTYQFTGATLGQAITITLATGTVDLPVGDAQTTSLLVSAGLLGAQPCATATNARIELRADGTSWFVCAGETAELQQGTWSSPSATTLDLTVSGSVTSTGQDIQVSITDITLAANVLTGTVTNFPLPLDATQTLGLPLPGSGTPNIQLVSVNITLLKTQ